MLPRTRSRRRRDRLNVSGHGVPSPLPPRVTADIAARMLMGQLLPEQTIGNIPTTMFAMLPAPMRAPSTSSASASPGSATARESRAVHGGRQGTRVMPAEVWFEGYSDDHGERSRSGE